MSDSWDSRMLAEPQSRDHAAAGHPDDMTSDSSWDPNRMPAEPQSRYGGRSAAGAAPFEDESTLSLGSLDTRARHDVDLALKKLWRRVHIMKRTHRQAAAHCQSRHFWAWFVPIAVTTLLSVLLSFGTAVDVSGASHPGLSIAAGSVAGIALLLILAQGRGGRTGRADVHRAAEAEVHQVSFRLDALERGTDGTESRSAEARAESVRDLYRIDVYLQALQRCTPTVPAGIHRAYSLLARRLHEVCLECPSVVESLYDEASTDENPVPVSMQIDALEMLGREIENYLLYPLFMPKAKAMVSRTIDAFFAKASRGGPRRDGGPLARGLARGQREAHKLFSRPWHGQGHAEDVSLTSEAQEKLKAVSRRMIVRQ